MKPTLTLVIMAAGMGSRYGGLKQIDPLGPNGEVIMDYSIYDAIKEGFNKVVFIIKKETEDIFKQKIGSRYEKKIAVEYVYQSLDFVPKWFQVPAGRVKPWGTGHAVLSCRDTVKEPFAVINADDFYGRGSFALLSDFLQNKSKPDCYGMVGFYVGNTVTENGSVSRGICRMDANNCLQSVTEQPVIEKRDGKIQYKGAEGWVTLPEDTITSMNTWAFDPSIFAELENRFAAMLKDTTLNHETCEFYLPAAVDGMIQEKKASVSVLFSKEKWFGVTHKEDRKQVCDAILQMVQEGKYPRL